MSVSVPNALSLTSIVDDSLIVASDHRNNYAATQVGVNGLIAMFTTAATKGDLLVSAGGGAFDRLGVGSNGQAIVADSAQTLGMKWAASVSIIAYGKATTTVSTTGTTFAGGADLLASALSFTADGSSDYILRAYASEWSNTTSAQNCSLRANVDSADAGIIAVSDVNAGTGGKGTALSAAGLLTGLSAATHTVNARLLVTGNTGSVTAGAGGAGTALPILVTIERA